MAVRLVNDEEWEEARELRLRALADVPEAFLSSYEDEKHLSEAEWRARVAPSDDRAWFVEASAAREFAGMIAVAFFGDSRETASLFGMWVEPERRRTGIGRRLVEAGVEWARAAGASRVELEVNESLKPAAGLYRACGFVPTGRRRRLPTAAGATAMQMAREFGS
jgi:ribosomal protein S18 acetylase RimI-like enzyme